MSRPCPTYPWCATKRAHAIHFADGVYLPPDTVVMVSAEFDEPARVTITIGRTQEQLTPLAARTLGHILIARRGDVELGEALIKAADLIEAAE